MGDHVFDMLEAMEARDSRGCLFDEDDGPHGEMYYERGNSNPTPLRSSTLASEGYQTQPALQPERIHLDPFGEHASESFCLLYQIC